MSKRTTTPANDVSDTISLPRQHARRVVGIAKRHADEPGNSLGTEDTASLDNLMEMLGFGNEGDEGDGEVDGTFDGDEPGERVAAE